MSVIPFVVKLNHNIGCHTLTILCRNFDRKFQFWSNFHLEGGARWRAPVAPTRLGRVRPKKGRDQRCGGAGSWLRRHWKGRCRFRPRPVPPLSRPWARMGVWHRIRMPAEWGIPGMSHRQETPGMTRDAPERRRRRLSPGWPCKALGSLWKKWLGREKSVHFST